MHRNDRPASIRSESGLAAALCRVGDARTMRRFLAEIFTSSELSDLHLRWKLMRMLHQGLPQRAIAARLGVSLCKITRGARLLKQRSSVSRRLIAENA